MAYGALTQVLDSAFFSPKNSLTMLGEGEKRWGLFRLVFLPAGDAGAPRGAMRRQLAGFGLTAQISPIFD
jgi:hypothetical protein